MKICFVSTSFPRHPRDGYARFVYEQAKSLLRINLGYEIVVVAPHARGIARREMIGGVKIQRFRYFIPTSLQRVAYKNEGLFNTLRSSTAAALQFPGFLFSMFFALWRESRGASVIHAQWLPTALVAMPVGLLRGIPVCVSVRGADLNSMLKSKWAKRMARQLLNRVDAVLTVSEEFARALKTFQLKPAVHAVFNGVDTEVFRPQDSCACKKLLNLKGDERIILFVGGLIARKGISTLLKAFAHMKSSLPEKACVCIVGDGALRAELEKEALQLCISESVKFVGRVDRDDVSLWMSASECLVLPSQSEGRPNVVLEAMAAGTPVIATGVNGTVEIIRSGHNGLLFRPGHHEELAEHLRELFTKPGKSRALAARALATLQAQQLSWISHGHQLDRIYRELIGQ